MSDASQLNTPVVFFVFNRPSQTRMVFERIAEARPRHLLVVADGPRVSRPDEDSLCERVREIATRVDWPCTVQTDFAEKNLGCRRRLVSGLDWVFEQVQEAIILEDDILPDLSFFPFCEEMLERFRGDSRISMISGFNIVEKHMTTDWSYIFSRLTHIWGWATWRSSWMRYDERLSQWPQVKAAGLMREYFPRPEQADFWTRIFDEMHAGTGPDTWDYQWVYTNLIHNALSVTPRRNLIRNIGFGCDATHTIHAADAPETEVGSLPFPLIHPPAITSIREMDDLDGRLSGSFAPGVFQRARRKLKRALAAQSGVR